MKKILLVLFILFVSSSLFNCNSCNKPNENDNPITPPVEKPDPKDENITEVYFTLDSQKYIVTSDSDKYVATYIKDNNYLYLVVEVDANDGYNFSEDTKVYINNELVSDHLTLSENHKKITYKISDPNWTPTY